MAQKTEMFNKYQAQPQYPKSNTLNSVYGRSNRISKLVNCNAKPVSKMTNTLDMFLHKPQGEHCLEHPRHVTEQQPRQKSVERPVAIVKKEEPVEVITAEKPRNDNFAIVPQPV